MASWWIVTLTQDGKWHVYLEELGEGYATYDASRLLKGSTNPWRSLEERVVESWAIEAPSRYQAIKIAKVDLDNRSLERGGESI